jgi:thiol-disulfide isomerase/thioredoxin
MHPIRGRFLIILLWGWICLMPALPALAAAAPASPSPPGQPAILEFSRDYCPICRESAKVIRSVQQQYPGRFAVRQYYIHRDIRTFERYKIAIVPSQVFLDSAGRAVYNHYGVFKPAELTKKLRELHFIR